MDNVKNALKVLIQGESDAVEFYSAFSTKAKQEGYNNVSSLFHALVVAERIHIKNHLNALGESFIPVKNRIDPNNLDSTLKNIKAALIGETEENKNLYPKLIKSIKKECRTEYGKVAKLSMTWAQKAEKEHAKLLKKAYKSLENGSDFQIDDILVCEVCGNIEIDKNDSKECEICGHDSVFFTKIVEV